MQLSGLSMLRRVGWVLEVVLVVRFFSAVLTVVGVVSPRSAPALVRGTVTLCVCAVRRDFVKLFG